MSNLSPSQRVDAGRYIRRCGSDKNPISLLMELGQQLHQSPTFDVYESPQSTVHQRLFTCDAKFIDCEAQVRGFNKKKVKTDAATALLSEIKQIVGVADAREANVPAPQQRPNVIPEQKPASPVYRGLFSSINARPRDNRPLIYSTVVNKNAEISQKQHTHTATPQSTEKSTLLNNRLGVRALKHHLSGLNVASSQRNDTVSITSDFFKDDSDIAPYRMSPNKKGAIAASLNKSRNQKGITTALERLKAISTLENFEIVFHDLEGNDEVHLCLLEAKIKSNFVCHGIGENQPQARENAAENLLLIIDFFKRKTNR